MLLLKEGSKIRLESKASHLGREVQGAIISDGSKTIINQGPGTWSSERPTDTPKELSANLATALARVGGAYTVRLTRRLSVKELHEFPDFRTTLSLGDFRATEDDGEAKTFTYTVEIKAPEVKLDVR